MFKAAKELRSSLIRNSLKSFLVSPLIRKFQVCAVWANMHWKFKQRKYMASEKKDGKSSRGQWAYCMIFFRGTEESKSKEDKK